MKHAGHISEPQLVAYIFGDPERVVATEAHLADCSECRTQLAELRSVLEAVNDQSLPVPEREGYADHVWAAIEPRLEQAQSFTGRAWLIPQRLVPVGGVLALVAVAFIAGRLSGPAAPDARGPAGVGSLNERAVRAVVGDHLERSQMMLVELANAEPGKWGADISGEQRRARDLLDANRLYRQSAKRAGDPAVSAVLDELERVLVEIANSPTEPSPQRLAELQRLIEDQGILFKIRVLELKVRSTKPIDAAPRSGAGARRPWRETT